ncbi:MAG: hypothetical protein WCT01_04925 [Candidatus Shapirobacteria bacterium]
MNEAYSPKAVEAMRHILTHEYRPRLSITDLPVQSKDSSPTHRQSPFVFITRLISDLTQFHKNPIVEPEDSY